MSKTWRQNLLGILIAAAAAVAGGNSARPYHVRRNAQEEEPTNSSLVAAAVSNSTSRTTEQHHPGIVGGANAASGEYPWFALFVGNVMCGGTLISPRRVLTAAHCVTRSAGPPTAVRIGASCGSDGEQISVCDTVVHPDYASGSTLVADLAILKLSRAPSCHTPVTLNVDTAYPSTTGTQLTVIGFGLTSTGGSVSSVLKKLDTDFIDYATCRQSWGSPVLPDVHVCAAVSNQGACQGDSGGPLFDRNNIQIGLVSFGSADGCALLPDVYTDVAYYYTWIQEQINSGDCCSSLFFRAFDLAGRTYHRVTNYAFGGF